MKGIKVLPKARFFGLAVGLALFCAAFSAYGSITDPVSIPGEAVLPTAPALTSAPAHTILVQASEPAPAAPTVYKIGDTGPAGGIIFYDKGNDSDGWRYLEAAPASTEWQNLRWGPGGKINGTTGVGMGAGKSNTQIIVDHVIATGGNYRAAWLCDSLEYSGYDDWFLPSKAELNLLFLNLKERGLGDFGTGRYWSSTEHESNGNYSWMQVFDNGGQDTHGKDNSYNVRAVRQF
jgi:hypothetical protein